MSATTGLLVAVAAVLALVLGVRASAAGSRIGAVAARVPGHGRLDARLRRAGVRASASTVLAGAVGAGMGAAALLFAVVRSPLIACAGLLAGVVGLRAFLDAMDRRHLRRVGDAMPAVAQMLASAVAAGLSLRQAIIRAARDTPDPLGAELQRAAGEIELGARVDDALAALAARLPDPDLGLLVTAILVQRRTGGDLARALRDMSGRLEERGRLARELRGATAQARATAWMVAALPLLGAALAEAAAPGLIARTAASAIGLGVLVVSVALQATGIALIRRIAAVRP